MVRILFISIIVFALVFSCKPKTEMGETFSTAKPWTIWWWMGSAVEKEEIIIQLKEFAESGIGGVNIIPIYGVQGNENNELSFLCEEWMEMLEFTICEAEKVGLGVDMTLGTGWPYGGPFIKEVNAAKKLQVESVDLGFTDKIKFDIESAENSISFSKLLTIVAINEKRESINLERFIKNGVVDCTVPKGKWQLHVLGIDLTKQKVKRAAPGGEGLVMGYFSEKAVDTYLNHFDSVFSNSNYRISPRAVYHDSYEVYRANWSADFFKRFKELRGYNLPDVLSVFLDKSHPEHPLVLCDIRETLSDLLLTSFTQNWVEWAEKYGFETRNQAHGSPGNILDYYAAASIPETESFGSSQFSISKVRVDKDYEENRFGRPSPLMMKFASSPAHLLNKKLVSSETATWLGNHFKVALSQVKPQIDELFVAGINHVFYHGATYTPDSAGFPGWLFYASTNFGRKSHFRDELPKLNKYIENCQSLLQNSTSDNDILLYFPIHDLWTKDDDDLLLQLDVHKYSKWFGETAFGELADSLWRQGYSFDYISDKQIKQLQVNADKQLSVSDNSDYSVILIPPIDFIKENTLEELESLAQKGATIIFTGGFPKHFAGYNERNKSAEFLNIVKRMAEMPNVITSSDLFYDLNKHGIRQENIKLQGLDFIRRKKENAEFYFITNLGDQFYEDSISLSVSCPYLEIFDPLSGKKAYLQVEKAHSADNVFLQLPPGKSCFIFASHAKPESEKWEHKIPVDTINFKQKWTVKFANDSISEKIYEVDSLVSWTNWGEEELRYFSGKADYSNSFQLNENVSNDCSYTLCIDDVRETAEVWVNGTNIGTIWAVPYEIEIPNTILETKNQIEIVVQNLSANKIIAIEKQGISWKKFREVNFVDIRYRPFDASEWELEPSGLIGEIYLVEKQNKQQHKIKLKKTS